MRLAHGVQDAASVGRCPLWQGGTGPGQQLQDGTAQLGRDFEQVEHGERLTDQQLEELLGKGDVQQMAVQQRLPAERPKELDRKSTRLNSSHSSISYAVFCLNKNHK